MAGWSKQFENPLGTLEGPKYNQGTYYGRLLHFFSMVNPLLLIPSNDKVRQTQAELDAARGQIKTGHKFTNSELEALWEKKTLVDSALHPDTGLPVAKPFRMSAFVPMNVPIMCGMLLTAPTIPNLVLYQWLNQSLNAGFNYSNRSIPRDAKGGNEAMVEVAKAYFLACASSCSVAVGFNRLVNNLEKRGLGAVGVAALRTVVPYTAVASAGVLNVLAMRWSELTTGVSVQTEDGQDQGKSQVAAKQALTECATSRVVLPAPILLIPPPLIMLANRMRVVQRSKGLQFAVNLTLLTTCVWLALPIAVAVFPQGSKIHASKLEDRFQGLKDKEGKPVEWFYFNKGV